MKVSGFTFLRNAEILQFPFIASIKSALPLCDEFIVNVGFSEDNTLEMVGSINDPKIKIIQNQWNERMRTRGFVYAQQSNIALFNCTGDWAFYLQGDELIHENDIPKIRGTMERYRNDPKVEALTFDYIHFYGDSGTYAWSPAWYRSECRAIKTGIRAFFPSDGQFLVVLNSNRRARYPNAARACARIFHYGWVRREEDMSAKQQNVAKFWGGTGSSVDYSKIDRKVLKKFKGTHPEAIKDWLRQCSNLMFKADPKHKLTGREKKHRVSLIIEKIFKIDLSKKHFKLVR